MTLYFFARQGIQRKLSCIPRLISFFVAPTSSRVRGELQITQLLFCIDELAAVTTATVRCDNVGLENVAVNADVFLLDNVAEEK